MAFVAQLWLPILLSAVLVFFASALAWMAMPHHRNEWKKLPDEAGVWAAIRARPVEPGLYAIPAVTDRSELKNPDWVAAIERGPNAWLTITPGRSPFAMGPMMAKSILSYLVISVFVAYIASHTLPPEAHYLAVFRIVATLGFMSFSFGSISESIWFGRPWSSFWKQSADALVYGCLMGGVFGWLWR